jgi:hypothetical protein
MNLETPVETTIAGTVKTPSAVYHEVTMSKLIKDALEYANRKASQC